MSSALSWQQQWQTAFKNLPELLAYLKLSPACTVNTLDYDKEFPLRVPLAFAQRMQKGNLDDPLLKQVLPLKDELTIVPGYQHDPLAEKAANVIPGLLHKYHGRVLLTLNGACAVHCRYCFRRHFPYEENNVGTKKWPLIFDYLRAHPDVNEVILSGGDPLSLDDVLLERFIKPLETIPSIKYLRFHTRFPVMIPARITPAFIRLLRSIRFRTTLVLHSNHPQEWNKTLKAPMQKLKKSNINLLNQAVLLHDINDSAQTLIDLSYRLYDCGVLPYYLHLLDKVSGAAHFDVSQERAVILMQQIIKALPGYLVPKLVYEAPYHQSKIPVNLNIV